MKASIPRSVITMDRPRKDPTWPMELLALRTELVYLSGGLRKSNAEERGT